MRTRTHTFLGSDRTFCLAVGTERRENGFMPFQLVQRKHEESSRNSNVYCKLSFFAVAIVYRRSKARINLTTYPTYLASTQPPGVLSFPVYTHSTTPLFFSVKAEVFQFLLGERKICRDEWLIRVSLLSPIVALEERPPHVLTADKRPWFHCTTPPILCPMINDNDKKEESVTHLMSAQQARTGRSGRGSMINKETKRLVTKQRE